MRMLCVAILLGLVGVFERGESAGGDAAER